MKREPNRMIRILRSAAAALASVAILAAQASADDNGTLVTQWTFETSVPTTAGPHAAETGTGSATGFHSNGLAVYSNPVGNGSAESFSSNNWLANDYYQFQTSTVGLDEIGVIFDQTRSSTGPNSFQFQYSTNGTTFTNFGDPYSFLGTTWSSTAPALDTTYSFDLRSVPALNNQPNVYFRLTSLANASALTGTNRVDNFSVYTGFIPPTPPPPPPDPELPVAGDLVFGLSNANPDRTIQLVSGSLTPNGGSYTPGPWSTDNSIQAVRFDNYGGVAHNVDGNLLGVRFSSGGTGQIFSFGTNVSIPAPAGELIGNTGATNPVGQDGSLTAVSMAGLSVSPNNQKIAVYGSRSANPTAIPPIEAYSSVIVYDYTPGNTAGSGAALAGGREVALALGSEAQAGRTQGTAWINDSKLITFSPLGILTEVTDNGTSLTSEQKATITTPSVGGDYAALAYNPDVSQYVYAMYSGFDGSASSAELYVIDPNNNYNLVNTVDLSTSLGSATAREIALDADGNLFISGFGGAISYIANAAANAATLADNTSVLWYTSPVFASFTGLDVGFAGASSGLAGDYNNDGTVNDADYDLWKSSFGTAGALQNETATPGVADAADYTVWRDNFGASAAGAGSLSAVPEPATLALVALGLVGLALGRRNK